MFGHKLSPNVFTKWPMRSCGVFSHFNENGEVTGLAKAKNIVAKS